MTEEISVSLEVAEAKRKLDEAVTEVEQAQEAGDELEAAVVEATSVLERKNRERERAPGAPGGSAPGGSPGGGGSPADELDFAAFGEELILLSGVIAATVTSATLEALDALLESYGVSDLGALIEKLRRLFELARRVFGSLPDTWPFPFPFPLPEDPEGGSGG